ncbi:MAG: iron-sulfur cluster insertion protein ErpA [Ignavibacteria bacterium]|nr:iron-sulfur cluster insertion protein ErpA [Ignavibacteria bacterium]
MTNEIITELGEIKITEKAVSEIKKIIAENNLTDEYGLRLGVKGGGCSGFSYAMAFDSNKREDDHVIEISGIKVFVDPKSLFYLAGTTIDFSDGLMGRGFTFSNPNASRTCGCGSSFAV